MQQVGIFLAWLGYPSLRREELRITGTTGDSQSQPKTGWVEAKGGKNHPVRGSAAQCLRALQAGREVSCLPLRLAGPRWPDLGEGASEAFWK